MRQRNIFKILIVVFLSFLLNSLFPPVWGQSESRRDSTDMRAIPTFINDNLLLVQLRSDRQVRRYVADGRSSHEVNPRFTARDIKRRDNKSKGTLVYSNTRGTFAFGPSGNTTNVKIGDDIIVFADDSCQLDRYVIRVTGDRRNDVSGFIFNYTVRFWLSEDCPNSAMENLPIPGTEGEVTIPHNQARDLIDVEFVPSMVVLLPRRFYLVVMFSRDHCGIVAGAPPTLGLSEDVISFPGSGCDASFGGYPRAPHSSFYLQVFANKHCKRRFPSYSLDVQMDELLSPGSGKFIADDIELSTRKCKLRAFDISLIGWGIIEASLRKSLVDSDPIDGGLINETRFVRGINSHNEIHTEHFELEKPINLHGDRLFLAVRMSAGIGLIASHDSPSFGSTDPTYNFHEDGRWQSSPDSESPVNVVATLYCEGDAPMGACCDMSITENHRCIGGEFDGETCKVSLDCGEGNCIGDAACLEVPKMNCPSQRWVEGGRCHQNPFEPPCGVAACCTPNDTCEDLVQKDCFNIPPVGNNRIWFPRKFCEETTCPFNACIQREGDCRLAHLGPGCHDPFCCGPVCRERPSCCEIEWDAECAELAGERGCFFLACIQGEGDCELPHPDPGCESRECCGLVCDESSKCCEIEWDTDCVRLAQELCTFSKNE